MSEMSFSCSTSRADTSTKMKKRWTMTPRDDAGATVKHGRVKGHQKLYRKHKPKPRKNKKSRTPVNVANLTKKGRE